MTVRAYLADWLRRKEGEVTPRTYEGYKHIIDNHVDEELGSIQLAKLRPMHIQNYLDRKKRGEEESGKGSLSGVTLRNHYAVLRKALQHAVSLRVLSVNPALAIASPKWERKDTVVLDEKQTMKLLSYAKGWEYYFPVYLAAYTRA